MLKKLFNVGLASRISNLSINNKHMGGMHKAVVYNRIEDFPGKYYVTSLTYSGDHVFGDTYKLWESRKFKTKDEATGCLTKEVRIAQKKFPWIYFFKEIEIKHIKSEQYDEDLGQNVMVIESEEIIFDEFVNGEWIRSKYEWNWDPLFTMRDNINETD
jgi:hypothetical protein